jgi:hypothetical protein
LSSKGADIRPYDVSSSDAVSGLKGIDVLISTTGMFGLALQPKLVDAAHAAGVKLFLPAEFSDTSDGRPEPIFARKAGLRAQAAALGLPTAAVFTGPWTEFVAHMGFDLVAGKITINGQGDAQISTTSLSDVAYFVAYVLTELPRDKLENAKFTLQGDVIVRAPRRLYLSETLTLCPDLELARSLPSEAVGQADRDHARPAVGVRGEATGEPGRPVRGALPRLGHGQRPAPKPTVARPDPRLAAEEGAGGPQTTDCAVDLHLCICFLIGLCRRIKVSFP